MTISSKRNVKIPVEVLIKRTHNGNNAVVNNTKLKPTLSTPKLKCKEGKTLTNWNPTPLLSYKTQNHKLHNIIPIVKAKLRILKRMKLFAGIQAIPNVKNTNTINIVRTVVCGLINKR